MIPKKIHYCWFGKGKMPLQAKKCISSWKKHCSDFEIIKWDESNFDINQNEYTKWCYANKKYAFLSDYVRLVALYENGGIYFDTDVEVVKNLNELLKNDAFIGFEIDYAVNTGQAVGAIKHSKAIKLMIDEYDYLLDGVHGVEMCPKLNTQSLKKLGLKCDGKYQKLDGITVYPAEYFNPYDNSTGRLNKTKNTVSIHWYAKTWMDKRIVIRSYLTKPFHRVFGENCFRRFK